MTTPSVPAGWKMVPVEPTPEMVDAGIPVICKGLPVPGEWCLAPNCECYAEHGLRVTPAAYKAMIATSPPLPLGWKMVPEEMTIDMSIAFAEKFFAKRRCIDDTNVEDQDWYAAMLAAAPPTDVARVIEAARKAAGWFMEYAQLHMAKGTPEGERKAAVNLERATEISEALAGLDGGRK